MEVGEGLLTFPARKVTVRSVNKIRGLGFRFPMPTRGRGGCRKRARGGRAGQGGNSRDGRAQGGRFEVSIRRGKRAKSTGRSRREVSEDLRRRTPCDAPKEAGVLLPIPNTTSLRAAPSPASPLPSCLPPCPPAGLYVCAPLSRLTTSAPSPARQCRRPWPPPASSRPCAEARCRLSPHHR